MRNHIIFIVMLWLFIGCTEDSKNNVSTASVDSLITIIKMDSIKIDSLVTHGKAVQVSINFAQLESHRYCEIVRKNPTQAQFITAWIDRQFRVIKK